MVLVKVTVMEFLIKMHRRLLYSSLVEHFEFFSEKNGERLEFFFTYFFTEKTGEKCKTFSHFFDLKQKWGEKCENTFTFFTCFFTEKIGEKKFKSFTNFFTEKLKMFNQWLDLIYRSICEISKAPDHYQRQYPDLQNLYLHLRNSLLHLSQCYQTIQNTPALVFA
jgi:hypothetical protein